MTTRPLPLGTITFTTAAWDLMVADGIDGARTIARLLERHSTGDWGERDPGLLQLRRLDRRATGAVCHPSERLIDWLTGALVCYHCRASDRDRRTFPPCDTFRRRARAGPLPNPRDAPRPHMRGASHVSALPH